MTTVLLFWASAAVVLYVYFGYPLLLLVWGRLRPKPVHTDLGEPPVSVVIAVRDEAEALERKIANLRSLDYPASHLQIVVVSDGRNPNTAAVLRRHAGIVDALYVGRGGKAQALNAGVEAARHDILVFADVRQRFDRQALHGLVAPLADPTVGGVSGELMLDAEIGGGRRRSSNRPPPARSTDIGEGLGGYWRYEKWLRRQESAIGSTMGATGAIYALRRSLWKPLPAETILDDVLAPMRAVLSASRVVFSSEALAFDPVATSGVELRRKIRTLAGNYQILRLEPRLLNPFRNPVWIQYMSHKVGRLLVPYALIALLVTSALLTPRSSFYALAFAAQLVFYALAAYGAYLSRRDLQQAESAEEAHEHTVNELIKGTTTS
jgi:cellulose synthase/poly-beta-1,6-N-acetylglucosamine synthase-like glycosyltransferase